MNNEEIFNRVNRFIYSKGSYIFSAIEVFEINKFGSKMEFFEVYVGDTGIWQEFPLPQIRKNLSRLTDRYLKSYEEYLTERLKEEYSDYLNNHEEYEGWVELLDECQAEIKMRADK